MIEDAFRKEHYLQSLAELGKSLPGKVEYGNLGAAVAYIEGSNKIVRNRGGSLVWAYTESRAARKSLKESTPL